MQLKRRGICMRVAQPPRLLQWRQLFLRMAVVMACGRHHLEKLASTLRSASFKALRAFPEIACWLAVRRGEISGRQAPYRLAAGRGRRAAAETAAG